MTALIVLLVLVVLALAVGVYAYWFHEPTFTYEALRVQMLPIIAEATYEHRHNIDRFASFITPISGALFSDTERYCYLSFVSMVSRNTKSTLIAPVANATLRRLRGTSATYPRSHLVRILGGVANVTSITGGDTFTQEELNAYYNIYSILTKSGISY